MRLPNSARAHSGTRLAGAIVTVAVALAGLAMPAGAAGDDSGQAQDLSASGSDLSAAPAQSTTTSAKGALARAQRALSGTGDREVSLALRDLFAAKPTLSGAQLKAARALLARPTDPADPANPEPATYTVPSTRICGALICLHYVTSTTHAPPLADANANAVPDWAETSLATLESVWASTGALGFRPPATDGVKGGDARFDVYLANIGINGLYGYCAPEALVAGQKSVADSYCVLDNDFVEFPLGPVPSLQVTAGHEFFHAVQFNYDVFEDRWLMEATATWIEERLYDDVNDNRQYHQYGPIRNPGVPVDFFEQGGLFHYGTWSFFELLSERYGTGSVLNIWNRLDATAGAPDKFSSEAVAAYLKSRGTTLPKFLARYGASNLLPAKNYEEGSFWPKGVVLRRGDGKPAVFSLRRGRGTGLIRLTQLKQLASGSVGFKPGSGARRLKVRIDGPLLSQGPAAHLMVVTRKGVAHKVIKLNKRGVGAASVAFKKGKVKVVYLTMANGSTRYKCGKRTVLSCQGIGKDNDRPILFMAQAS